MIPGTRSGTQRALAGLSSRRNVAHRERCSQEVIASADCSVRRSDTAAGFRAARGTHGVDLRHRVPRDLRRAVHRRCSRRRHELERFALLQAAALRQPPPPDLSLWDAERITAWRQALNEPSAPPLAVLRIRKIRLEVPVLPGTDDMTLNRAVGHIDDTALPGTDGNSGIAGHRDGFF